MKQLFMYLAGFSLLAIATVSCSKEGNDEMRQQAAQAPEVMKATVPAGQTYVLDMGAGNTASIQAQARHYQFSEMATAPDGNVAYKYTPAKGYTGTDEVTLQQTITYTSQGGGWCGSRGDEHTTTAIKTVVIKFDVAN